jgi:hypothetical protein
MFQQSNDYISRPITTHGRITRLPHQGARHGTVDHGDTSDDVFLLLHLWVLPSRWAILLRRSPSSLSSLWMASRCEWLSLSRMAAPPGLRVEDPSGARKRGGGGRTDPGTGPGRPAWADRPRPIPTRLGHPFTPVSPCVIMHFAPSTCTILTMSSSHPRWRFSVHEVGLLRFNPRGCSFVTLRSSPPLEVISSSS